MNRMKHFIFAVIAAFAVTACQPAANTTTNNAVATNTNANSNSNAASTAAAPTKEAMMTLERSAYDAWKNKDAKFWDPFLTSNFVGFSNGKKLDKAAAIKEYGQSDCDVKSVALSDDQMTPLGPNAVLMTYKTTTDATCGGQKIPTVAWTAGVYVREGNQWKGAFHADAPVRDQNAPPMKSEANAAKPATAATPTAATAAPDAATDAMFTLEKKAWDDWKSKNQKAMEDWASPNLTAFTSDGRQPGADAIKTWMSDGCEVKSVSLTDPSSITLGPDHGLLLFKAAVDGKCKGTAIPPEYGASVYAKEGGTWKAVFTMGTSIL
ncbi:MAG: nuclear transport factor 2 family protein [Acidobacteriota bacterium]